MMTPGACVSPYPNDRWNWALDIKQVGENFNPALCFVNRPETRQSIATLRRRWRPVGSSIRFIEALGLRNHEHGPGQTISNRC